MKQRIITLNKVLVFWFLPTLTSKSTGVELVPVATAIVGECCLETMQLGGRRCQHLRKMWYVKGGGGVVELGSEIRS